MKNIKVAVAGLGFIGPVHIEALRRIPNIEVVAVFHPDADEVKQKAEALNVPNHFSDYEEMLKLEGIDCVHICTPNFLHYEMSKSAIEKGLNVVCEKPLSITTAEAAELVQLAADKGVVNAIHFNLRYYPMVRQMKVMREKGELGEIYSIIGSYLQDWLFYQTDYNWRLETAQSGDSRAIADVGSHLMDALEYISGIKIVELMADFNTVHKTRKKPLKPVETYAGKLLKPEDYKDIPISTEDYASVLLHFDNGHKGVITVSQVAAGRKNRMTLEISGSKGNFHWCSESPNEMWIGRRDGNNEIKMRDPSLFHHEAAALISYPGGHNEGFPDTSKQMFKEVYADIRNGKSENPTYPTFKDGHRELLLCDAILLSNKDRKWVTVE